MSIMVRPISANLTHDTEFLARMDPYAKIYFGGQQYRTQVSHDGGKHPSWNDVFTFNAGTDSNLRVQIWDSDASNDDLIGEGSFNLMGVYNTPSMCSDNEHIPLIYKGRSAGTILISFKLQGMNGCWGGQMGGQMGQQMGGNWGNNNSGWGNQPMNNFSNQQPFTGNNGWGVQPPMNNGFGMPPPNNGWNNMPPQNGGWGQNPNNGWGGF